MIIEKNKILPENKILKNIRKKDYDIDIIIKSIVINIAKNFFVIDLKI